DMGYALVDKSVTDAVVRRLRRWNPARNFGLFELTVARVRKQVIRISRTHDACSRQRKCDAGRIHGDPATAPLFGDVRRRSRATGGIQDARGDRTSFTFSGGQAAPCALFSPECLCLQRSDCWPAEHPEAAPVPQ